MLQSPRAYSFLKLINPLLIIGLIAVALGFTSLIFFSLVGLDRLAPLTGWLIPIGHLVFFLGVFRFCMVTLRDRRFLLSIVGYAIYVALLCVQGFCFYLYAWVYNLPMDMAFPLLVEVPPILAMLAGMLIFGTAALLFLCGFKTSSEI